ncbi:uncharacterized protein LOC129779633 [Toxorhynchites rutilus septentrionalis]|uniref:uncharacterized protein LOC129779633 n=1 Tax=Toxorhynchites rutilus septentrionalis TaxID=329112 RepID=UPI002479229F|nr:uncharacterized protein LOC129779633 [Toxorhynchites rutilus septentrionalis]
MTTVKEHAEANAIVSDNPKNIPVWLNEQFFEDIFVEGHRLERNTFRVKINTIVPTGGAGENYTSMLYRANVDAESDDGDTKTLATMVKVMDAAPEIKQFGVFAKEKIAYQKLLPTIEQLWMNVGETVRFGPRCWKTIEGEIDLIVMDDLNALGYSVADRKKGVDLQHAQIFLTKLAKFHAVTATDYRKNGPIHSLYDNGWIQQEGRAFFEQFLKCVQPLVLDLLDSWPGYEKYKLKLEKNFKGAFDKLMEATMKDDSGFVALCHGDTWTNNHMYSYHESDKAKDVLLIDYQGPYYGSPVLDILYYIITSTELKLKTEQFDELVQFYQEQLADNLRKLNYPGAIPNLREIHIEILRHGYFAMQCLYSILPVVLADKNDNANLAGFVGDAEENRQFRRDVFNNPLYHEHLKVVIKMLDVRGFLDHD